MSKVPMTATANFRHGGRRLTPGDTFETTAAYARQLRAIKRAIPSVAAAHETDDDGGKTDTDIPQAPSAPDPVPEPDSAPDAAPEPESEPDTEAHAAPRKRHYKRRDMTAEGDAD